MAKPKKKERCDDCPVLKGKKTPIVERTTSRGTVELKFPGLEASFPGTNRSVMVIIIMGFIALMTIVPAVFYQIFSAEPESLETLGRYFGWDDGDKPREPVKMQVQTSDGIEIIEVCPPCREWSREECEERYGECGVVCPQCSACPMPIPPPRKGEEPLL